MYAGRGVCSACYLREWRKTHPVLESPNGHLCRCGCGEECRGNSRLRWISGHRKRITVCMCGCGTPVGENAYYVQGHQPRPARFGRKHSTETRAKMSAASKGRKKTPEHALAIGRGLRKNVETVNQRKALIRKWAVYRAWRTAVFERDHYTCQLCSQVGGKLEADHIQPIAIRPDLIVAVDNGRTLCVTCHRKTDSYGTKVRKLRGFQQRAVFQIPLEMLSR